MGEIPRAMNVSKVKYLDGAKSLAKKKYFQGARDLQHHVRLVPAKIVLNVHCRLRLDGKANQTQQQETSGIHISLPRSIGGVDFRVPLVECPPAAVQHGPRLGIIAAAVVPLVAKQGLMRATL